MSASQANQPSQANPPPQAQPPSQGNQTASSRYANASATEGTNPTQASGNIPYPIPPEFFENMAAAFAEHMRQNAAPGSATRTPTTQEQTLQEQLDELKKLIVKNGQTSQPAEEDRSELLPFSDALRTAIMPTNFTMPIFTKFTGVENPETHLSAFVNMLQFYSADTNVYARAFPQSLTSHAQTWFTKLPRGSIDSWQTLKKEFRVKYGSRVTEERADSALFEVRQTLTETLRAYYARFEDMATTIPKLPDTMYIMAFMQGLLFGPLKQELVLREPKSKTYLLDRINEFIRVEEAEKREQDLRKVIDRNREARSPKKQKHVFDRLRRSPSKGPSRRRSYSPRRDRRDNQKAQGPAAKTILPTMRTPLTISAAQVFAQMRDKTILNKPSRLKAVKRDTNKWCEYHKDHGHTTDECRHLKQEIERLIQRGHLAEFIDHRKTRRDEQPQQNAGRQEQTQPEAPPRRIATIAGGPGGGGDSGNQRKAYARRELYSVNYRPTRTVEPITFSDEDLAGIEYPHDDPLIITPMIGNFYVERMLVDTGSSADILFCPYI